MAEHRVSMLRSSLRRRTDPARSRDPRVRSVVAQLSELATAPGPDPQFRSELRAQLVAIAPRIVAENGPAEAGRAGQSTAGVDTLASATAPASHADRRGRRVPIARALRVCVATLAVCALLLGGAVWMSRKALPGDALYGLKRAGEGVQLTFAGSDRAQDQLDLANTRAREVYDLWRQSTSHALGHGANADAGISDRANALITETLASADADLTAAAKSLNAEAVRTHSATPLRTLTGWAPAQLKLLSGITAAMPQSTLRTHASYSRDLVQLAVTRADLLGRGVNCPALRNGPVDKLGPVPPASCTATTRPTPKTSTSEPSTPTRHRIAPSGTATTGPSRHGSSAGRSGSSTSTRTGNAPKPSSGAPTITPPGLPTLPVKPPKVRVGSCLSVSAGPIQVGVGACGPSS